MKNKEKKRLFTNHLTIRTNVNFEVAQFLGLFHYFQLSNFDRYIIKNKAIGPLKKRAINTCFISFSNLYSSVDFISFQVFKKWE